jgi:hypothetical protein
MPADNTRQPLDNPTALIDNTRHDRAATTSADGQPSRQTTRHS